MTISAADKMIRARANLIMLHPFFGTLALRLKVVPEPGIKGARTDGTTLRYDPDYVDTLTGEQCVGLVAGTVMHPAMLHHTRRGGRDLAKWNKACDYSIADILKDSKLTMPEDMQAGSQYAGMSAEHIYQLLPDSPKDGNGKGQGQGGAGGASGQGQPDDGSGNGGVDDSPGQSTSEIQEEEHEWKQALAQAAHIAKQQGNLPGSLSRLVDDILEPSVDWKQKLLRFMNEKAPDDFSWQRPNRRHIAEGLYLPSMLQTATGEIVVVVDTSGSIGEKELSEFGGEIQAILTDLKPRKVHVIYCDAAINKVVEFGPHDPVILEAVGGGGTSFKPPFKYVEDHQINPRCLVYLTDGYGDFPDEDKVHFPTLWAINNHDVVPPFGEHVVIQV
jgi:predicted metal-dependent peptidase